MKKRILILGLILAFGMVSVLNAQTKMGFTNVELLLNYMPEMKNVQQSLARYEEQLQAQISQKQNGYQKKIEEYQKLQETNSMTQADSERRVTEIQKLEQEIQNEVQQAELDLLKKREELLVPVTAKLQEKIDEVAREGNFTYIINNTVGSGIPTILYGMETMDVTDQIAAKLGIRLE